MMGRRASVGVVIHLKSGASYAPTGCSSPPAAARTRRRGSAAGLAQTERGWLKVDPSTLEAQPGVFGAGDVTGLGGFTHLAYYHGQIVARRLRGWTRRPITPRSRA
jgi:hypothetical protein